MINAGYTKLHRKRWFNPVFNSFLETSIWSWMIESACFEGTRSNFNGQVVDLSRGQFITSTRFIAEGFEVSTNRVHRLIKKFEKYGFISTRIEHKGTVISVCNYDKYQCSENTDRTQNGTAIEQRQNTSRTNKKEYNKLKEINNIPPNPQGELMENPKGPDATGLEIYQEVIPPEECKEVGFKKPSKISIVNMEKEIDALFNEFWYTYQAVGRAKGSKKEARDNYEKAIKKGAGHGQIINGAKAYAVYCGENGQKSKDACRWLKHECWADDYGFTQTSAGQNMGRPQTGFGAAVAAAEKLQEKYRREDEEERQAREQGNGDPYHLLDI